MSLHLTITPEMTLGELKNAFHAAFPQLKVEFYKKAHTEGTLSPISEILHQEHDTIGQYLQNDQIDEILHIEPAHTVWETEKQFEEKLKIHAQLFRKMGSTWIASSKTDTWTLAHQIERSLDASKNNDVEEKPDYREQD